MSETIDQFLARHDSRGTTYEEMAREVVQIQHENARLRAENVRLRAMVQEHIDLHAAAEAQRDQCLAAEGAAVRRAQDAEEKTEAAEAKLAKVRELAGHITEKTYPGGEWLGEARKWLQRNKQNGARVAWGSQEVIQPPVTARDVDDIATAAARGAGLKLLAVLGGEPDESEVARLGRFEETREAEWQSAYDSLSAESHTLRATLAKARALLRDLDCPECSAGLDVNRVGTASEDCATCDSREADLDAVLDGEGSKAEGNNT